VSSSLGYLLDTNVVSEPLRPEPSRSVLRQLRVHEGRAAIASLAWHELWFGCMRLPASARRDAIGRYLEQVVSVSFPILGYDRDAAEWHARERARLGAAGTVPPFIDGQIAAIACVHDLVLVTANRADFRRFRGLRVEDWR
jgi:tRNA(fMet)-specific endonuclease VapC